MDSTLKSILGLVAVPDVEVRCAALVVLGQLGDAESKTVATVGEALAAKNALVRDFAVGYFERVRPKDGISYLVPLLDSSEDVLRERVTKILSSYGAAGVAAVRKLVGDGPRRRLHAIITMCAAVHSAAALDVLFELMSHDDFDTHKAATDAVVALVPGLDSKARADLWQRSEKLLKAAKSHRPATIAAAKLFGALAEPRARKLLLPLLDKEFAHSIRTHALGALVQCLRGEKLSEAEMRTAFGLLEEDDESGILRPAIALLDEQTLDRSYLPVLNRLAEGNQPVLRRFAVQKLGAFDSGAVVKTLIGYLSDDSYARRDQAATSLKKLPAARAALMSELLACEDERKAWTLSEILLQHDRNWKGSAVQALQKKLESAVEKRDDRLYTAYFHFLHSLDPEATAKHVRDRSEALRKKKDFHGCVKWLSLLKDTPAFEPDVRFALAVADLKARKHAMVAAVRRHDPTLDLLRELARAAYPVVEQLRKDRSLEAEELFYVAFNFAEGSREERALAEDLLEHVAHKYGRTKTGKAAKNKLKLMGGGSAA